jgi:hypothetical protein
MYQYKLNNAGANELHDKQTGKLKFKGEKASSHGRTPVSRSAQATNVQRRMTPLVATGGASLSRPLPVDQ